MLPVASSQHVALIEPSAKDPAPARAPSIFQRALSCKEWLLFPTPSLWAIIIVSLHFKECPALPLLATFSIATSCVCQISAMLAFVYRLPFSPCKRGSSFLAVLATTLDIANVGLVAWGGSIAYPEAWRLTENGGDGCNMPCYLTGFLCSAIPTAIYAAILVYTALMCCRSAGQSPVVQVHQCS